MAGILDNQQSAKRHRPSFASMSSGNRRAQGLIPRIALLLCVVVLLSSAGALVYSVITAPVLPPENLAASLREMVEYHTDPANSRRFPTLILPAEDHDWARLTFFEDQETGTGAPVDRTEDIEYRVKPGETLSGIAYAHEVPYNLLAYYNNIANANRIRGGMVILIPSLENARIAEQQMARQPRQTIASTARVSTKTVKIGYESHTNGTGRGITVQFSVLDPLPESLQSFEWDFGDGKRGLRANPVYEYTVPKTYVVRLTARDATGTIYRSNPLYIDLPYPSSVAAYNTTRFVTLSAPDEYFVINGTISSVARYASVDSAPLDFSESDQFLTKVRFTRPGFYGITTDEGGIEHYYSVFVSPLPSMHADAAQEITNWYRTQFNTGTTSNCGPASVSMAIGWSLKKYFPVASVRQAVGWQGDGGTSLEELQRVIHAQGIPSTIQPLRTVQHVKDVIDSGSIAIILFRTDGVRTTRANPGTDLFGKYYVDSVGHYIVVKGYSLNGEYFIIYDPIPSDWSANTFRYDDDVSMIGRNRYYSSGEILRSLRRAEMIVVSRSAGL